MRSKKAEKFFNQNCRLVAPGLEMIYLWHGFTIIGRHCNMVERIHQVVLDTKEEANDKTIEDECLLELIRGLCLKHMGFPLQAEEAFNYILSKSADITTDTFLVPYASVELAILLFEQGDPVGSSQLLNHAKSVTGYSLRNRLQFKIHGANKRIKKAEQS